MTPRLAWAAAVLLLASCSTIRQPVPPAPTEEHAGAAPSTEPGTGPGLSPPEQAGASSESAVVALLEDADRRQRSGQVESAAATLERALRIAPADPLLWYRLAAVRLDQRRWEQAEALAQKSLSLASGDPRLQAANWRVIAEARRGAGDAEGAAAAAGTARRLETQSQ